MQRLVLWLVVLAVVVPLGAPGVVPVEPFYATSDSMSPTIEAGDLYFVLEGDAVDVGDVVAFESASGGGYVTHRVVAAGTDGYVTRGDANPTTDQSAGAPPVDRADVIGTVVTVGGEPLVVPGVAPFLLAVERNRVPVAVGGVALAIPSVVLGRRRSHERGVTHVADVVGPLFVGGLVASGVFLLAGTSTHTLQFIATEGAPTTASTVPVGEAVVRTVTVDVYRPPLTTVIVEADGMAVLERAVDGSRVRLRVRVPATRAPGPITGHVGVHAYPATLPRPVLEALHGYHWLAAAGGSLLPVFGPLGLLYVAVLDGREPLTRSRWRWYRRLGGG